MARTSRTGRTGSAPSSAGATIATKRAITRSSIQQIQVSRRPASAAPNSPRCSGPFARTEFFASAGYGFHSNDVRGVTITQEPGDPTQKLDASPFLVRTKGAEIGMRTKILPGLDSSVSVFRLDQASELVFSGDAGDTEASRPSRRVGVEFTNTYRPRSWLAVDGVLAMTRARFVGFDQEQQDLYDSLAGYPQAQIGNA